MEDNLEPPTKNKAKWPTMCSHTYSPLYRATYAPDLYSKIKQTDKQIPGSFDQLIKINQLVNGRSRI